MAKQGGLRRWFAEEWVDIGSKKKKGKYQPCGRKSTNGIVTGKHLRKPPCLAII